jgi:hypothetical protein
MGTIGEITMKTILKDQPPTSQPTKEKRGVASGGGRFRSEECKKRLRGSLRFQTGHAGILSLMERALATKGSGTGMGLILKNGQAGVFEPGPVAATTARPVESKGRNTEG